ncbi:hypothetical protein VMCG_03166 [Cytospora schulzeri]|uniref:Riboflavin kinase n=1 Tax=Cytospora schulzeri TaxID=448051 RepID=A0A423WY91_9PEZI|nr:hypothetical protein VMCG_03166 [Valsa malicola]
MGNTRPVIVGPESGPESPFPLQMEGKVIKGFGRGSKEVSCSCNLIPPRLLSPPYQPSLACAPKSPIHPSIYLSIYPPTCPTHLSTGSQVLPNETLTQINTQLGIPTANLPVDATVNPWISDAKSGVYFGWASLELPAEHPNYQKAVIGGGGDGEGKFAIFPMVMSIGYNPFYNNTVRSAEVHVLNNFGADFYGVEMRLLLLGYIRDELNYEGLEALIKDINMDCEVAKNSLARETWKPAGSMGGKLDCSWLTR